MNLEQLIVKLAECPVLGNELDALSNELICIDNGLKDVVTDNPNIKLSHKPSYDYMLSEQAFKELVVKTNMDNIGPAQGLSYYTNTISGERFNIKLSAPANLFYAKADGTFEPINQNSN